MRLVLLVSFSNSKIIGTIKNYLPENYSLLEREYSSALRLIKKIPAGIVLVDLSSKKALPWVENAHRVRPDLTYLAVGEQGQAALPENCFFDFIPLSCNAGQVKKILDKAWERAQLNYNAQDLQKKAFSNNPGNISVKGPLPPVVICKSDERILCDFSRALGNNFNSERLLNYLWIPLLGSFPQQNFHPVKRQQRSGRGQLCCLCAEGLDPYYCSDLSFSPSSINLLVN